MRVPEGVPIGLIEKSLLDSWGVLKGADHLPGAAAALPDESIALFLLIAGAGEGGLTKTAIPKHLKENLDLHLLPLELQQLVSWERDNRGRLAYLVLTWKGQEALDAARPREKAPSMSKKRRASLAVKE